MFAILGTFLCGMLGFMYMDNNNLVMSSLMFFLTGINLAFVLVYIAESIN